MPIFVSAQVIQFVPMAQFPNRIRELRMQVGWSQDLLADVVGCSKPQISDLERGNRRLDVEWMRRISKALGVLPADLLSKEDNPMRLDDKEREIIARYRAASSEGKEIVERVAETVKPYRDRDAA